VTNPALPHHSARTAQRPTDTGPPPQHNASPTAVAVPLGSMDMQPRRSHAPTSPHASKSSSATLRAASMTLAASITAIRMPQDTCRRAAVSGAPLPAPPDAARSLLVTGRGP